MVLSNESTSHVRAATARPFPCQVTAHILYHGCYFRKVCSAGGTSFGQFRLFLFVRGPPLVRGMNALGPAVPAQPAFGAPSGLGMKGGAQAPAFGQAVPAQPAFGATSSLGAKPTLGQAAPTQPASGATSFGAKAGAQGTLGLLAPAQPAFGAASTLGSTAASRTAGATLGAPSAQVIWLAHH